MSKLSNALTMLNVLSARSVVGLEELSDILEVSVRGVQRLRDDLEMAGYTITSIRGPQGGYSLERNAQIQPLAFNMNERKLLKQSLSILLQQNSATYSNEHIEAISKLAAQIDYHGIDNAMAFQSVKLNVDLIAYQKHLEHLEYAINHNQRVNLHYQKNHRQNNTYRFEAYELVLVNQFWYVLGYDERGRYLSLKVNRITSVELLQSQFRYDEDTSHRGILSDFGYKIKPVKAELLISKLDYLSEYIWGTHQNIEWLDDHVFKLTVEFPNELAIKDFILKGGRNIEVIHPSELKEWVKEEAKAIAKMYDTF